MNRVQLMSQRHQHRHGRASSGSKAPERLTALALALAAGGLLWAEYAGKLPPKGTYPIY